MPAPTSAPLGAQRIALRPLAEAVADRYFAEFPEDLERYGEVARAWEIHDTSHCLQWALLDAQGLASLEREVAWLTTVLSARDFPLEHLARNLELAADVVEAQLGEPGAAIGSRLRAAAAGVRTT
jgi:hypothetical protein